MYGRDYQMYIVEKKEINNKVKKLPELHLDNIEPRV
jgi:hypothetical protein